MSVLDTHIAENSDQSCYNYYCDITMDVHDWLQDQNITLDATAMNAAMSWIRINIPAILNEFELAIQTAITFSR